jgi:hypothetical protein
VLEAEPPWWSPFMGSRSFTWEPEVFLGRAAFGAALPAPVPEPVEERV